MAEVVFEGGDMLRIALLSMIEHEEVATRKAVRELALRLTNYAKREASGPARVGIPRRNRKGEVIPYQAGGPGVVTGTLRRSIVPRREGRVGAYSWFVDVAPGTPYSRRLELGFVGTDSLGRRYAQPPYPYMKPAREKTQQQANQVFTRIWREALSP